MPNSDRNANEGEIHELQPGQPRNDIDDVRNTITLSHLAQESSSQKMELVRPADEDLHKFTLLTNHTHVLVLIAQMPDVRMREIASIVGITERAVQRIIEDLTASGYVVVTKSGRRNRYEIRPESPIHHPLARHCNVGDLIRFVYPKFEN